MARRSTPAPGLGGLKELQKHHDAEQAQGFSGPKVDPTPNSNYTVAGVAKGAPTPETDARARARASRRTSP